MNVDRMVFAIAGSFVLISLVLGHWVHPYWLLLAAFVGLNMLQAAFSEFCPMAIFLKKLGCKPGPSFK